MPQIHPGAHVYPLAHGFQLDASTATPLYRQITAQLRALVQAGKLTPGDAIPGEVELAEVLGVSRLTVRQGLAPLVAEGLLVRKRGVGTVVGEATCRAPLSIRLDRCQALAWDGRPDGRERCTRVVGFTTVLAPAHVAEALGLPLETPVYRLERVFALHGESVVLEVAFIPRHLAQCLDAEVVEHGAVYEVWERQLGLRITHARQQFRPIHLDRRAAGLLRVPTGSPAFAVERVAWAGDQPLEVRESMLRGDRYQLAIDVVREEADTAAA